MTGICCFTTVDFVVALGHSCAMSRLAPILLSIALLVNRSAIRCRPDFGGGGRLSRPEVHKKFLGSLETLASRQWRI